MKKGIIVLDKEKNLTSRDEVNRICKLLNTKKVGHTGTLDPMATGVLIICIGKYTKLVDLITSQNKEYIATVKLGILTDTLDTEGTILLKKKYDINKENLIKVLDSFVKTYEQEVPIYSAVKVNGKKLYEYARNNEEVKLPKKMVTISEIELLDFVGDSFKFRVNVSKGTYIRSLIYDIAKELDTVAIMSDLIRTKQGNLSLNDCYNYNDIENNEYNILKVSDVLNIPIIELNSEEEYLVSNGVKLQKKIKDGNCLLIYQNNEIAIYNFQDNIGKMKVFLKDV